MRDVTTTTAATTTMTPLELVSGFVRGFNPEVPPLSAAPPGLTARGALEQVMLRALQKAPCVVSFSGGRDSSSLLAIAAHVARRESLPLPVPVTARFAGHHTTDEDAWQELVIRHLQIDDWVRLPFQDELDFIGPHARAVMTRHGLLWPANAHFVLPIAAQAPGGSVVTGFGGDELLTQDPLTLRVNQLLAGKARPEPRDVLRILAIFGPAAVRRRATRHRLRDVAPRPWLLPNTQQAVTDDEVAFLLEEPLRWDRMIDVAWWRTRYRFIGESSLTRITAMHGAEAVNPFAAPLVLGAITEERGRGGYESRTTAMEHLVGDLLPTELISRESKASFGRAFWNRHSAEFVQRWDGTGVDRELVDVPTLRQIWSAPSGSPDFRTSSLLQSAWLASADLSDPVP